MNAVPVNIFQQLMRRWDQRHPYNAAQVMRIAGRPDADILTRAWRQTLANAGLGRLRVESNQYWFESLNGSADTEVALVNRPLCEHISPELNRRFAETGEPPFRPFVIGNADDFFAGLVYQHWVADSVAIRLLMRDWFVRVFDPPAARKTPMRLPARGFWNSIGPHRGGWEMTEGILSLGRRHTRLRRVQKIDSTGLSDPTTRFILLPTPAGLIQPLSRAARRTGVKLNDVFLAALATACRKHIPMQRRKNRPDLAVGSVVDLRPFCPDDLSRTFGLYLGFTNVVCRPRDLADFDRLLNAVSNQTRMQKSTGVAAASLMWMGAAVAIGKMSRLDELYHFYRKELPLAGGISNVDLTRTPMANYHPSPLLEYIRISPTGPMTPLALTTTTLGNVFNVGLTHRLGLIAPPLADAIGQSFLKSLCDFAAA